MLFAILICGLGIICSASYWWWPEISTTFSRQTQPVHNTRSLHLSSSIQRRFVPNVGTANLDLDQQITSSSEIEFEKECLEEHNRLRAIHGAPPLKLDRNLCKYAQEWANHLANTGRMEHRSQSNYGENLFMSGGMQVDGRTPVKTWYDEIKFYKYGSEFSPSTGHFTQVVWKDTRELGCAFGRKENLVYIVANYYPPGNYRGRFPENVLPPKKFN